METTNPTKTVIIVSYAFPPMASPVSIHMRRLAKYLPATGWHPIFLTADPTTSLDPIDPEMTLPPDCAAEVVRCPSGDSRWRQALARRFWPGRLSMPDPKLRWIFRAAWTGARILRQKKVDAILSYGQYHTSHLAGERLASYSGIPWVSYHSDPWMDNPFLPPQDRLTLSVNQWMERMVYIRSDRLIFTTPETIDLAARRYNDPSPSHFRAKCHAIPHGFDPEDWPTPVARTRSDILRLAHVGNFYGDRTPEPLINALSSRDGIVVDIYGHVPDYWQREIARCGLTDTILCHGTVGFAESQRRMSGSDGLVVIDGDFPGRNVFLPQKLMEYMGARRPILGITPIGSPVSRILASMGQWTFDPKDSTRIRQTLRRWVECRRENRIIGGPVREEVAPYDVRTTTAQIAAVLDSVRR